ncbi:PREDICTED: probable methyltransferase BTM2 homolog [Polistes canadensis]|uniref:probable methyltransferase BTM2 homolog n=1 Tax=Polistes canadensis TaxID=91411 RepID=UPI000718CAF3|nr:PREDICTED: probable methyltransferase BTM2 homolog [Polistes canadensis]
MYMILSMATEEHKRLANVVKQIHALLRKECEKYGPEIAWKMHLSRNDVLQKYVMSMKDLATTHWKGNNMDSLSGTYCRIEWIKSQCKEYFFKGGKEKYSIREFSIKGKMGELSAIDSINKKEQTFLTSEQNHYIDKKLLNETEETFQKISILDVGSCYNPFEMENMFKVTAIDLVAVPPNVFQCDFLSVDIGREQIFSSDKKQILQLPEQSFDVVVFSLLLEYMPCPKQRYLCCSKAYNLLKNNGILFIISPDSKHIGANAKLIKSWRYVLSKLGFMRIKYEKLRHIHCLIFRKCIYKEVALRWTNMQTFSESDILYQSEDKIFIPQDFKTVDDKHNNENSNYDINDDLLCSFNELPFAEL